MQDLCPEHRSISAECNKGDHYACSGCSCSCHPRPRGLAMRDPSLCLLEWSAPDGCELDDRKAWAQANPGLSKHDAAGS